VGKIAKRFLILCRMRNGEAQLVLGVVFVVCGVLFVAKVNVLGPPQKALLDLA